MRDMADEGAAHASVAHPRTIVSALGMIVASLITVMTGFVGFIMWAPTRMAFTNRDEDVVAQALFIALSAGPVLAASSFVVGWLVFMLGRNPGAAARLMLAAPMSWAVLVLAYFAGVSSFCEGAFLCGVRG